MQIFQIDPLSRVPIYEQLKQQVLRLASLGLLEEDGQIPSVRQLAADLGVNPNTVSKAYRELEREELIYSVPGKGSFLKDPRRHVERLRSGLREKLRALLAEGREAGLSFTELNGLFEEVGREREEEEENHD